MTAPNQPDPNAPPAAPPAPPAAPPAPPAPPLPTAPPAAPAFDPSTLSPEAQAYLKKAQADAEAAARVKARDAAKTEAADEARKELAAKLATALGINPETPPDPAKLQSEIEALRGAGRAAQVEIALFRAASGAGADPVKLADSRSFMTQVDKLDPADADFATKLQAAITAAVTSNPGLKLVTAPAAPGAGEFGQGPGAPAGPAAGSEAEIDALALQLGYGKKR